MGDIAWQAGKAYREIIYETIDGIAKITINRPERRNAFTPLTVNELYDAFTVARDDPSIGVIILTGANHGGRHEDEAFCSGGDQKIRGNGGYVGEDSIPAPQRAGPAEAHPRGAQARRRHGERLRHRRRTRAAHPVRPVHCGGNGQVRPDRPQGGQLRRRLWRRLSGGHRGSEEGARDLVSLPPVHGCRGAGNGPGEQGGSVRSAGGGMRGLGARNAAVQPHGRCAS